MTPAEIIARKRDGHALTAAQVNDFVAGITSGAWSDAQVAAMAMAVLLRGMQRDEAVALTEAMTHSGTVLQWDAGALGGPVFDKHSTGGVGDKVSLMLAPMAAACGGFVPMISGRGLGHSGGTLDKLEALPGYTVMQERDAIERMLRACGCAIVGASAGLAPADKRLYAIRDVTATVESIPLITASILSKKRAAGLQQLVLDVKFGSGAFMQAPDDARALARSLVQVARAAGLPTVALLTDMNQVLGRTAGHALEVREALDYLSGAHREARLHEVTLALTAEMLVLGGLASDAAAARAAVQRALDSGEAAERFARMVAGLSGPADVFRDARLAAAPVVRAVPASSDGVVVAMDVRALGWAVVALGGGRRLPGDRIDPRVGLAGVVALGTRVGRGEPLAWVHAADEAAAEAAVAAVLAAVTVGDAAAASSSAVVMERVEG